MASAKAPELIQTPIEDKAKELVTIEEIVNSPIACGYLLRFCREQFCAENLEFWIAVDQFKDKCKVLDYAEEEDLRKCGAMATAIWQEFLSQNSSADIFLPSGDRKETIDRLSQLDKYKHSVFDIALKDPVKVMRKDIRPRFINHVIFKHLVLMLQIKNTFMETPPPKATMLDFDFPENKDDFTMMEIICDKYLYQSMLAYLLKRFSAENLLCLRGIQHFEETLVENGEASSVAWNVYRLFIEPGAPKEISCQDNIRKSIQLQLASPKKDIFQEVKNSTLILLNQDYIKFRETEAFQEVLETLQVEKKARQGQVKKKRIGRAN